MFTAAEAVDRLTKRRTSLAAERRRIESSCAQELARVDAQVVAIGKVLTVLGDANEAKSIDALLAALEAAGLRLEVADR